MQVILSHALLRRRAHELYHSSQALWFSNEYLWKTTKESFVFCARSRYFEFLPESQLDQDSLWFFPPSLFLDDVEVRVLA